MDAAQSPAGAEVYLEQGNRYLSQNELAKALSAYDKALALNPRLAEVHYNRGVVCHRQGDLPSATVHYRRALTLMPDLTEALFNLAHACTDLNRLEEAEQAYQRVLDLEPMHAAAAYNLGNLYKSRGRAAQALRCYEKAIRARPDYAEAWNNMGLIRRDQDQLEEAQVCFQQALAAQSDLVEVSFNLGVTRHMQNDNHRSLALFKHAMQLNPGYAPARWFHALALPMLYNSEEQIDQARLRFEQGLDELIQTTRLETENQRDFALQGIASFTNFYLQYQGRDDLPLQKKYGAFAAAVMASNYPHWSIPRHLHDFNPGEKIRLGYVSSLLYGHTIGIFLLGWLARHDRDRFELFCYHVGTKTDALTAHAAGLVDHFYHIPGNLEAAAHQIDQDALHVLVHTDVGMNPVTFQLAALRLAPVQCKGWGHPVTTGLPTIDYFLSSDLMEPSNGREHYSETLVRLPNLALVHAAPELPASPAGRDFFNIPKDRFVYLSTQSLFKYLPQHDDIYPRIAQAVPQALFVFIAHGVDQTSAFFKRRLSKVFQRFGMDADQYCLFVPKLCHADFLGLNLCADVVLDTLDWSGGKTSMEALWCDVPVVTCPGALMRARHTYAFLKRIQCQQTIAGDKAGYIRIAVRCAVDRDFYAALKTRIKANKHLLFNDQAVIPALEDFFSSLLQRSGAADQTPRTAIFAKTPAAPDALIQDHYQLGRRCMAADRPDLALVEFEKALSWIPTYLGVLPWFQKYLLDGRHPRAYPRSFVGQLYALMSQCLERIGRMADSRQYAAAALRFDAGNPLPQKILSKTEARFRAEGVNHFSPNIDTTPGADQDGAAFLGRMTVLMFTHVTHKLKRNRHLQAPGSGLVQQTYHSLLQTAGSTIATHCPKFLCLDRCASPDRLEKQYEDNLRGFAAGHGFQFKVFDHCGLQHIVRTMLDWITTPYLLFLEHDWRFQLPPIPLGRLLALFDQDPAINMVRWNKRSNMIANYDYLLSKEQTHDDAPLLRTVCHSNNPSVMRVATLRQSWLPLCLEDPLCRQTDLRGKALGLEEPLFKQHIKDVRRMGFAGAHAHWGTYIYGGFDAPPHIVHLGE